MVETDFSIKSLKGWRAEVGMLAPWGKMYREWEVVAPEGVRFSNALLGLTYTTPEGLKEMANQIEAEAKKLNIGSVIIDGKLRESLKMSSYLLFVLMFFHL